MPRCARRGGIAWSAVRSISDRAEDGDVEMVKLAKADGTPDGGAIARYFARHPGRIPYMVKVGRGAVLAARNAATHRGARVRATVSTVD